MSLADAKVAAGRRFARFVTNVVVPRPVLWRVFRPLVRKQFDALAPSWSAMRSSDAFAVFEEALGNVSAGPARALDLGTGTGLAAFVLARRFPEAEVTGADLSPRMLDEARRSTPPELRDRVQFDQVDASRLPYDDASFDLVTLANMIPFFDELARVVKADGRTLIMFSSGDQTPIYVPFERLRSELGRRGFTEFAEFAAGGGTALLASRSGAA